MPPHPPGSTAAYIRQMIIHHRLAYTATEGDDLAGHFARLADNDAVEFDEVEQMLLALQRAGHIDRNELVRLQANYLRETKR